MKSARVQYSISRDGGGGDVLILKTAHSIEEINYKATLVSAPLAAPSTIASLIPAENELRSCIPRA